MPLTPSIRILDSVTNIYANLEMKDYVKYLGLMIDSNLSWKYHIESICHIISKSTGIIAKIRHYVQRRVLHSVYNSLIVPYLTVLMVFVLGVIHLIPKWRSLNYSFVCMLI